MRKSKTEMVESRRQILTAAARLFRERGPDLVSVADVMQAAGMTHGGFYKHFASKEALLAAAIAKAFSEKLDMLGSAEIDDPDGAIRHYIEGYLSMGHVEDLGTGCPIAGLTGDAVRASADVSTALATGAEATIAHFAKSTGGAEAADAIRALSSIIGSVVLARAVSDPALKRQILSLAKASLPASLALQNGH